MDRVIDNLLSKANVYMNETEPSQLLVDYVVDIVNVNFSLPLLDRDYILNRITKVKDYMTQLAHLRSIPKIEQRSQEWYEMRKKIITASDFAQALGDGKFGTQKQFFKKKCGYEVEKFNPNVPPLKWGVMFEPVATNIYEVRNNTHIHDFGLVPHPHIPFFGASPDGITDLGIMLEIKCPYKRKITGEIPLQYYYQIQGQLDVCGLNECDYLECEFEEYSDVESFKEDTQHKYECGIIIEYMTSSNDIVSSYKYSPPFYRSDDANGEAVLQWVDDARHGISNVVIHYWRLNTYNVVRVYKNKEFIKEKFMLLKYVWDQVCAYVADKDLYLKEVGAAKTKSAAATQQNLITGYAFLDDDF